MMVVNQQFFQVKSGKFKHNISTNFKEQLQLVPAIFLKHELAWKSHEPSQAKLKIVQLKLNPSRAQLGLITNKYGLSSLLVQE